MNNASKHLRIASVLVILLGVISILGVILFVAQLWNFFQAGSEMVEIIINIVLLVIPYYYLHNAYYTGNMLPA